MKTKTVLTNRKNGTTNSENSDLGYEALADILRAKIVEGAYKPGEKIPTWDTLCSQYKVGRPTLMRALTVLKQEGFICSQSTRGTFVSQTPPHLFDYELLFPSSPDKSGFGGWNLFWKTLLYHAIAINQSGPIRIHIRFDVSPHSDCEVFREVEESIAKRRIAGLLIPSDEALNAWTPKGIPYIRLCARQPRETEPSIGVDWSSFYRQAALHMKENKHKRVAILAENQAAAEQCATELEKEGIFVNELWRLSMPGTHPEGAKNLARLLLHDSKSKRPDGLIVTNDSLVSPVIHGAIAEKLSLPEDLAIVAHTNSDTFTQLPFPICWLGFDIAELLNEAIAQLQAKSVKPCCAIPAHPCREFVTSLS